MPMGQQTLALLVLFKREECILVSQVRSCFTVFSQRLAGHLMEKGFVLIDMQPHKTDTRRNVFFFKESNEIKDAINEYKSKH